MKETVGIIRLIKVEEGGDQQCSSLEANKMWLVRESWEIDVFPSAVNCSRLFNQVHRI
jgi:hypothetical protein